MHPLNARPLAPCCIPSRRGTPRQGGLTGTTRGRRLPHLQLPSGNDSGILLSLLFSGSKSDLQVNASFSQKQILTFFLASSLLWHSFVLIYWSNEKGVIFFCLVVLSWTFNRKRKKKKQYVYSREVLYLQGALPSPEIRMFCGIYYDCRWTPFQNNSAE